jgi:hypothetical protein
MSIATSTRTLVVNPAFLQEIKDSNPDLWAATAQLAEIIGDANWNDQPSRLLHRLTRLLDDLRDQLALQFSLEESYGYIEVPWASSRVSAEMASRAQAQHRTLYLSLSDLAEQAEELQYRGVEPHRLHALIDDCRSYHADLREHESLEMELIRRSLDVV